MNTIAKSLVSRARDIIHDPERWTRCSAARDQTSRPVCPRSPEAQRFCGYGALVRAAHEQKLTEPWLAKIFGAPVLVQLIEANSKGHATVLDYLERLGEEVAGGFGFDL